MNEYPFHQVDNETTRKQASIDYEAKLKGEDLPPIEWGDSIFGDTYGDKLTEAEESEVNARLSLTSEGATK